MAKNDVIHGDIEIWSFFCHLITLGKNRRYGGVLIFIHTIRFLLCFPSKNKLDLLKNKFTFIFLLFSIQLSPPINKLFVLIAKSNNTCSIIPMYPDLKGTVLKLSEDWKICENKVCWGVNHYNLILTLKRSSFTNWLVFSLIDWECCSSAVLGKICKVDKLFLKGKPCFSS